METETACALPQRIAHQPGTGRGTSEFSRGLRAFAENRQIPLIGEHGTCQAISNGYRAGHRRAIIRVTEIAEDDAC